jgi:hypothetical protein
VKAVLAAGALALSACAGGGTPPPAAWVHPSVYQRQLEGETVVVLPVGGVTMTDAAVPSDSGAAALAWRAGEAIATALETGGAAGLAVRPVRAAIVLGAMSESQVDSLYAPLTPAALEAGGEITGPPAAEWREVADRTEQRFVLVPRSLRIARLEPLRVRADVDAWLVDAAAALVLWHAVVTAVNPHAPSGAAADVYEAALEDAIDSVAATLADRLARVARTGRDD